MHIRSYTHILTSMYIDVSNLYCVLLYSIKPSVNVEVDDSPLYEELDTIKDERYSGAVASTKSRINSAITSNHSSYIEMHPSVSINDLAGRNVIMQPNPSYHAVANTNS